MAIFNTRAEIFEGIKKGLGFPLEQCPDPDLILDQMFRDEQSLVLRVTNKRVPWSLISYNLTTTPGTNEYTIGPQPVSKHEFTGKVYFVVRNTGQNTLPHIPVPYEDVNYQSYGQMIPGANAPWFPRAEERISFYRSGTQDSTRVAIIQPTPVEALQYTIYFFPAGIERNEQILTLAPMLEELADWRKLIAQIALLPHCQWRPEAATDIGLKNTEYNTQKKKEFAASFKFQYEQLKPEVDDFIGQMNEPVTGDIGYCLDVD